MGETITRAMLVEYPDWPNADGHRFGWEGRTQALAADLYPDSSAPRRRAMFAMDVILQNTFEDRNDAGLPQLSESLLEDQVEDWLVGRAVDYALTQEKRWGASLSEVTHG